MTQREIDAQNERALIQALAAENGAFGRAAAAVNEATVHLIQHQRQEMKVTETEDDRVAVAKEIAEFYLNEVPDASFDSMFAKLNDFAETEDRTPASASVLPEVVTLKDEAGNTLTLDEGTFADLWGAVWNRENTEWWTGGHYDNGIAYLAEKAAGRGLKDVADKLTQFKAAMKGKALVLRPDGKTWSPTPVSKQSPETATFERVAAEEVKQEVFAFFDADEEADEEPPKVVITAGEGRSIELERATFDRLVDAAGIEVGADISRAEFGALVTAAKDSGKAGLLQKLLDVRSTTSPLYRVKDGAGRAWKPAEKAAATENDIHAYFGSSR